MAALKKTNKNKRQKKGKPTFSVVRQHFHAGLVDR